MASSTWTTPKTWNVGDTLTSADMDTYVRDNSNAAFGNKAEGRYTRAANQSFSPSGNMSFDTQLTNTDGFGTVTTSTFTIPTGLGGRYLITFACFAAVAVTFLEITAGGVVYAVAQTGTNASMTVSMRLAAAATIVMTVALASNSTATGRVEFERTAI